MKRLSISLLFAFIASIYTNSAIAAVDWSRLKNTARHDSRRHTLDFSLLFGYLFGSYKHLGVASWYGLPILPDGLIDEVNDALFLEAGGAFEYFNFTFAACDEKWWRITPMAGVRYQFYLTHDWSAFATTKVGWGIGFNHKADCGLTKASVSNFAWDASIGAYWHFSENWHMRLEFGAYSLSPGIGFQL
ncbi:MAG: hypothetical protein JW841_12000 [Deltaproteobacteria bacterium]|nr:hypothetical protein [Deltaproteobacteria bacterium]